jgi:hypothetical protein
VFKPAQHPPVRPIAAGPSSQADLSTGAPAAGRHSRAAGLLCVLGALLACAVALPGVASAFDHPFVGSFDKLSSVGSTVPSNGDENPYGIVNVSTSSGSLVAGDILISNFNNSENLQGTGTTIVQLSPNGHLSLFAQINPATLPGACPGGVGLTTALAILPQGFVVVGSLPTKDGSASTAEAGCLIELDSSGHVVQTISGAPINGPWDMTAVASGQNATLFVTNVLNGTVASGETPTPGGTVVRVRMRITARHVPKVTSMSVIATGFPERTDPAALVVGPTGVALGDEGTLYVADTQGNRIAAVPGALNRSAPLGEAGQTVAAGGYLNNPLGLTLAPNGDILTANANDGNVVETTPVGAEFQPLNTEAGGGGLFGLTVTPTFKGVYFVNDSNNTLGLAH